MTESAASSIVYLEEEVDEPSIEADPGTVMTTCANCGAVMIERKCKLICRCGYFLSCSDYY
jgi:exosome complex RNA-binding protein Csl4